MHHYSAVMFQSGPDGSVLLIAAGVLSVCVEFLKPGAVLPGVGGCLAVAFGVASLVRYPLTWQGLALIALAVWLLAVEARFRLRGIAGAVAAVTLAAGLRQLVPAPGVGWLTAAGVGVALAGTLSILLTLAWRARVKKRTTMERTTIF